MTSIENNGIVDRPSRYSVDETVARIQKMLATNGVTLFAVIDHSGEAAKAGMSMRPTKLLIFGNPKAGTPVMLAAPRAAIDLPLKLLVWEGEDGEVRISFNTSEWLMHRHGVGEIFRGVLGAVEMLAGKAGE